MIKYIILAFAGLVGLLYVHLGYLIVFLFCIYRVILSDRSDVGLVVHYSAVSIYCTLSIALQIIDKTTFWGLSALGSNEMYYGYYAFYFYIIGYEMMPVLPVTKYNLYGFRYNVSKYSYYMQYVILAIMVASFFGLFANYELNFTARGLRDEGDSRAWELFVFSLIPKMIISIGFSIIAASKIAKNSINIYVVIASFFIFVFACSPVNTPRQLLIIGLLPLIIYILRNNIKYIMIVLWFGVVLVGPVLNFFSRDSFYGVDTQYFPMSPDFDAMFIGSAVLGKFESGDYGLGYGRYIINAFGFFLPRDLKFFSEYDPLQGFAYGLFSQTNVSFPPFFTAYLDCGFLGCMIMGIFLSFLCGKINYYENSNLRFDVIFQHALLASIVPFMRGPILGWGFFFLSVVVTFFVYGVFFRLIGVRNEISNN